LPGELSHQDAEQLMLGFEDERDGLAMSGRGGGIGVGFR
jgi:hypothetical protein